MRLPQATFSLVCVNDKFEDESPFKLNFSTVALDLVIVLIEVIEPVPTAQLSNLQSGTFMS